MTDAETENEAIENQPGVRRRGWALRPLAYLVAAQLVAGVVIGISWRLWSPSTVSYLLSASGGGTFVIPDESEAQIAGDGRFVVLSIVAGLAFGLLAWWLRSVRGLTTLFSLAIGGALSSLLARAVGQLLSSAPASTRVNSAFTPRLSLHAFPALWVQAFFAVLGYTALVGLSADPELGRPAPTSPLPGGEFSTNNGPDGPNGPDGEVHDGDGLNEPKGSSALS
jgi:hypothetical protein